MSKNTEKPRLPSYSISPARAKSGNIWAWHVSIQRQGRSIKRNFSFIQHGGQAAALLVAVAYRDENIRLHPPMTKLQFRTTLRSTNTSGIAGVKRVQRKNYAIWEARTRLPGRYLSKNFSVAVYGEEDARQKAIEERQRQLAQVENAYRLFSQEARELYSDIGESPEDAPNSSTGTKLPS